MKRILAILLAGALLTACGSGGSGETSKGTPRVPAGTAVITSAVQPTPVAAQPALPVTVKDKDGRSVTIGDASGVVSLNGDFTEIIYALGLGEKLVAVDTSATFPAEAKALATIGYQRTLAAEGILSKSPTVIIGNENAGPPAVIEQIRGAGVPVLILQYSPTVESAPAKIRAVAEALGVPARGAELATKTQSEIDAARALAAKSTGKPKVAFLNLRGASTQQVWGKGTVADAMIAAAGAANAAAQAGIDGSKPITPEALVGAAPEVCLVTGTALESVGGVDGMLAIPGLAQTPAGRGHAVLSFEDQYLLGLGPRTGQALLALVKALHPE